VAEKQAQAGDFIAALETLRKGYDPELPLRFRERIEERYLSFYAESVARSVAALAQTSGWRRIGVVPLVRLSEDEIDGDALAGRICRALADTKKLSVSVRSLSADGSAMLMSGTYQGLPAEDRARVTDWSDDALVLGRVGRELSTFIGDIRRAKTTAIQVVENPLSATGAGRGGAWDDVLANHKAAAQFQVRLWTDQREFRAGSLLRFFARSNRDCFVTVVLFQTDGSARAFLPIFEQQRNYVAAHVTYSFPNEQGPRLEFPLRGPAGTARVGLIATAKPFDLGIVGKAFGENDLVEVVTSRLAALGPAEWTLAGCGFEVAD
jgi:hypothetical protein